VVFNAFDCQTSPHIQGTPASPKMASRLTLHLLADFEAQPETITPGTRIVSGLSSLFGIASEGKTLDKTSLPQSPPSSAVLGAAHSANPPHRPSTNADFFSGASDSWSPFAEFVPQIQLQSRLRSKFSRKSHSRPGRLPKPSVSRAFAGRSRTPHLLQGTVNVLQDRRRESKRCRG